MPRYFFTTEDGAVTRDFEGEELTDIPTAKREAVMLMGSILRDHPDAFLEGGRWRMVVADKPQGDLFTVEVSMQLGSAISDWGDPQSRTEPGKAGADQP